MKQFKSFISLLLAIVISVSCCVVAFAGGSTFATAESISFGTTYYSAITDTNSKDFYTFTLPSSGKIKISTTGGFKWIYIYIYDADGNEVFKTNPIWNSTTELLVDNSEVYLVSGKYYLCYSKDGSNSTFNFNIKFTSSGETIKESQTVNNNSLMNANIIDVNKNYKALIANNDEKDFYKFEMTTSGSVNLKLSASMRWIYIKLFTEDGTEIKSSNPSSNTNTGLITVDENIFLTEGTYYIGFIRDGSYNGNYNFTLNYKSSGESFRETGSGTNNILSSANTISLDKSYKGMIALNDSIDFYKFTLSSATKIRLKFTATNMNYVYIKFYKADGTEINSSNPRMDSNTQKITFDNEYDFTKGTYYLGIVKDGSNTGNYSFTVYKSSTLTVGTPKSLKATPSTKSIKLTWNKVSGAAGYVVYKYTPSTGKYTKLGTTTSVSYTVKDLKPGKGYSYAVKAYKKLEGKTIYSNYSVAIAAATKPSTVSIKVTGGKKQAKISWSKIDCTKYVVYMATSKDGTYSKIATTSATSVTKKDLKAGKTYYFKVRAYKRAGDSNIYGAYSSVKSAKVTK